ncbi:MAG TPA: MarR family transcriptional regulator [Xanthobacteraceae bacterium]|jgi:DNA-binding MarR family transcriptional regulator|nr:MarR family transcriptional regulator [Xanthobacteraceae bacterium]
MPAELDNDLLILLSDVARHMRVYADQLAQGHGMTRAQLIILARLESQPDLSQNELAAFAEVAPMTIARLIDRLEELGFVKRCPDPEDRRIWRLRLTPAATPLLREIKHFRAKLHSAMTKGIEPAVLKALAVGLRQMKENVSGCRSTETST